MKKILVILAMMVSAPALADDHGDDKKAIMGVLTGIFDAMREGDADKHRTFFIEDAAMGRMTGKGVYQPSTAEGWSASIASLKSGHVDETLHDVKILVEGTLAMAWTPFKLNIGGELRSCGVNQFTMGKIDGAWKVIYAIDIHTPTKCKDM